MNKQTNTAPMGEIRAWCELDGDTWHVYSPETNKQLFDHITEHQKDSHYKTVWPLFTAPAIPSPVDQDAKAEQGDPRILVIQIDSLCSQIENTLYAFRGDEEAITQAKGAIEHSKKVAKPFRHNGRLAARSPVAAPDAEAIRSAAALRTALTELRELHISTLRTRANFNAYIEIIDKALSQPSPAVKSAVCPACDGKGGWVTAEWTDPVSGPECEGERCADCEGTGVLPADYAPLFPAVKSAEPDYRDLYEKCKREKAAAYERLAKYEDVKMVKSAEPTGGAA